MSNRYVQIDTMEQNEKRYMVVKPLDENGKLNFKSSREYFEVCKVEGQEVLKPVSLSEREGLEKSYLRNTVKDMRFIERAIKRHMKYDRRNGFLTDILQENMETVMCRGFTDEEDRDTTCEGAGYYSFDNSIDFYDMKSLSRGKRAKLTLHEIGHMKLTTITWEDNQLIERYGLGEDRYIGCPVYVTETGDEVIALYYRAQSITGLGSGVEEWFNNIETNRVQGKDDDDGLDRLINGAGIRIRHSRDINEFVQALQEIIPSEEQAQIFLTKLDAYYLARDVEGTHTLGIEFYKELGKYIVQKCIISIQNGQYSTGDVSKYLAWQEWGKNFPQEETDKIRNEIREKVEQIYLGSQQKEEEPFID